MKWWFRLLPKSVKRRVMSVLYQHIQELGLKDELVRQTIRHVGEHYDTKRGRLYANTAEEVEAALSELPSELRSLFKPYEVYLHNICANQRREAGLQV